METNSKNIEIIKFLKNETVIFEKAPINFQTQKAFIDNIIDKHPDTIPTKLLVEIFEKMDDKNVYLWDLFIPVLEAPRQNMTGSEALKWSSTTRRFKEGEILAQGEKAELIKYFSDFKYASLDAVAIEHLQKFMDKLEELEVK